MYRLRTLVLSVLFILGNMVTPANADIPKLSADSFAIRVCSTPTQMECLESFNTILPNGKSFPAKILLDPAGSYVDTNGQVTEYNSSTWSIMDVNGKPRKISMTAYILPEKHVNPAYKRLTPTMWIGLGDLTKNDVSSGIKFKISIRSSWLRPQGAGMFGAQAEMLDEKISGGRRYTFIGSPILTASLSDPNAWANLDTAKSDFENPTFYFLIDHWSSLPNGSFYSDECAETGYGFTASNAIGAGQPYMTDRETLKFNIGSAHLLSTGEINTGFFRTKYPVQYLDCRWPGNSLTKSSRIEVSVVNPDGTSQVATTSVKIQNGIFTVDAYGFHYSQPTIVLKTSTDTKLPLVNVASSSTTKAAVKSTITCLKGKVNKKVTGIKPVCPKGYKQK